MSASAAYNGKFGYGGCPGCMMAEVEGSHSTPRRGKSNIRGVS